MIKSALLLPAHGHAPYLLGAKILRSVASEICIPDYYGESQRNILMEELQDFPEAFDRIFLSESLGNDLKPLLRDEKNTRSFHSYVRSIRENFEGKGRALKNLVNRGVEAVSLSGTRKKITHFDFALNTGLPVLSPVDIIFYAFVGEMSAIYSAPIYQNEDTRVLADIWLKVEAEFDRMFIPRLHSLAYLEGNETQKHNLEKIAFTPPLETPYLSSKYAVASLAGEVPISYGSTLVIFSGTGQDKDRLYSLANSAPGKCFTLQESPEPPRSHSKKLHRVHSSAWGNPDITTVLARSGLGSVWKAVLNKKPIGVLEALPQDDLEIYHNARMVEWAGIGKILRDRMDPLINAWPGCQSRIQEWHEALIQEFNTVDGFEFTANELKQRLLQNKVSEV